MQAVQEKPPYVTFEYRPIENRAASIESGHYSTKDVAYAIITPAGSKDKIEKEAEVWLKDLEVQVREGRFPMQWLEAYKSIFRDWKEGRETPIDGTAIMTWPAVSPAQREAILNANIRTVEHLAEANESALVAIGMGARGLKRQAEAWLQVSEDKGKIVAEVTALRQADIEKTATIREMSERLRKLEGTAKEPKKSHEEV